MDYYNCSGQRIYQFRQTCAKRIHRESIHRKTPSTTITARPSKNKNKPFAPQKAAQANIIIMSADEGWDWNWLLPAAVRDIERVRYVNEYALPRKYATRKSIIDLDDEDGEESTVVSADWDTREEMHHSSSQNDIESRYDDDDDDDDDVDDGSADWEDSVYSISSQNSTNRIHRSHTDNQELTLYVHKSNAPSGDANTIAGASQGIFSTLFKGPQSPKSRRQFPVYFVERGLPQPPSLDMEEDADDLFGDLPSPPSLIYEYRVVSRKLQ